MKFAAMLFLLAAVPATTLPGQAPAASLRSMQDHQRVLLVFSNGNNALAEAQLDVAASHIDGFHERDLVLAGIRGSNPAVPAMLLSTADDTAARRRFHVAPSQFTVILLGKDGGEKLRSNQPIPWEKLQSSIDGMPMRKDEMRRRGTGTEPAPR